MKSLQEISTCFHVVWNQQQARKNAIQKEADKAREASMRYQRLAAQKMGDYYKLWKKSQSEDKIGWVDGLLVPLLNEIEERTSWKFDNKDDLCTYGFRSECPVYIASGEVDEHDFKKYKSSIVFTPEFRSGEDSYEWDLYFDTGKKKEQRSEPGTIAYMHGFDNVAAKVESVEQVIEFLRKQMEE